MYGVGWAPVIEKFIAVGENGSIYVYGDGQSWGKKDSKIDDTTIDGEEGGDIPSLLDVVSVSSSLYLAVGENGIVAISSDGNSWNPFVMEVDLDNDGINDQYQINAVAAGISGIVAVGENGLIYTSNNGSEWGSKQFENGNSTRIHDIHFSEINSQYFAVGDDGLLIVSNNA